MHIATCHRTGNVATKFRGIVAVGLLLTIVSTATAKYSGGTGEPNDPYQIATAADLIALGDDPNDYDKHFILTADIDLDPNLPGLKVFDKAVIAPDISQEKEVPTWFEGTSFSGEFDGNRHVISHLTIKGDWYLGLFGQLAAGAVVTDVGVVDIDIAGSRCGIGGLTGWNSGTVTQCYSTGAVSGAGSVGGLVGVHDGGTVTHCYSASVASGSDTVAGLVGWNIGTVTQCYSAGAVVGIGWNRSVGGFVGRNNGTVTNCYSTGRVSGDSHVGGLVGDNWGTVAQCYSEGAVDGNDYVGGLVGATESPWGARVLESFWNIETSGRTKSAGGTGNTTAEMQTAATFLDAGWDFVGETANGSEDIWKLAEGLGYPRLSWEKYGGGTGEPTDPYQIGTAEDLIALGETPEDYDKRFILTADIDLAPNLPGRKVFDRAVIAPASCIDAYPYREGTPFTGVFDGDGHVISHLRIEGGDYGGLFGELATGAVVKALAVVDVNISGSDGCVGGLVASSGRAWDFAGGTVTQCYSTGSVVAENGSAGGLVGDNIGGAITDCYSTAAVCGADGVGGLVGVNADVERTDQRRWHASILRCYSTGTVGSWVSFLGYAGLVRYGDATDSFWDTDTSCVAWGGSTGKTGKTTAEMQTAKTFLDAGWDFVGETANGTEEIWWILEGKDYPRLWWEAATE